MTAGRGIVHSEMFPLRQRAGGNHTELFQIWLNLPARNKMVGSHFAMFWQPDIPRAVITDDRGWETEVVSYCGALAREWGGTAAPQPPPHSWARDRDNGVVIWTIKMAPGAAWTLPAADPAHNRQIFFFKGESLNLAGRNFAPLHAMVWATDAQVDFRNGGEEAETLLLQGRPINEPADHHGPFVMNSHAELQQAFMDYQRTEFGGWQWPSHGPVHPRDSSRFAKFADGRVENGAAGEET